MAGLWKSLLWMPKETRRSLRALGMHQCTIVVCILGGTMVFASSTKFLLAFMQKWGWFTGKERNFLADLLKVALTEERQSRPMQTGPVTVRHPHQARVANHGRLYKNEGPRNVWAAVFNWLFLGLVILQSFAHPFQKPSDFGMVWLNATKVSEKKLDKSADHCKKLGEGARSCGIVQFSVWILASVAEMPHLSSIPFWSRSDNQTAREHARKVSRCSHHLEPREK